MIGPHSRRLLIALHFLCPLFFFTDLTRNPYFSQIALLNIGVLAALALAVIHQSREGEWRLPKTPLGPPLVSLLAVCSASWGYAYFAHAAFFRESMRSEGIRAFAFLFVNAAGVFVLAAAAADEVQDEPKVPLGGFAAFWAVWTVLWLFWPQLRGAPSASDAVLPHLWDPFGAFLWGAGIAAVLWLTRKGGAHAVWHAVLSVGFFSAVYAIAQYFSYEIFWPKILNPYGGRSVSTFGNPNFLSSYVVMVLPMTVAYYLTARSRLHKAVYLVLFLCLEASLLCTLTRSSWVGAAAALAPLAVSRKLRARLKEDIEFHGLAFASVVLLTLLWPASNVSGYAPSVIGRIVELGEVAKREAGGEAYSPLYQRVLIWLCSWTMGAENPVLGKGFGLMELFYPFYQGHYIDALPIFRTMRTHANNSHNEIIEMFSQTGLAGLGVFLWMWATFFTVVWKARGRAPESGVPEAAPGLAGRKPRCAGLHGGFGAPGRKGKPRDAAPADHEPLWLLAASGSVLGMLVDNLLNVSLHFAVPAYLFWWQAGTVMGALARRNGEVRRFGVRPGRAGFAIAASAAALCAFGSWYWVRQWYREVHYFMGFKYMRRGLSEKAVAQLEKSYAWHPREVNAVYELGNAYARTDRFEKAVWAYTEALNANAGYDEIYFNRGTILGTRLGKDEEAMRDYQTSWQINPLNQQVYTNYLAMLLRPERLERTDRAVSVLRSAVEYFPDDPNFLLNLGFLHGKRGEHREAEEVFARILRKRPEDARAEQNLRVSLARSGNPAPPVLARLDEFRRLARLLTEKKWGPETLALGREVFEWFPGSLQAAFFLGNLEMMNGDPAKAEALFRSILATDPKNVPVLLNLSQALKRGGKTAEAIRALQAVLAQKPDHEFARRELSSLTGSR